MSNQSLKRSDDLRAENRFRLLQILRHHGSLTRTELATLSGLSQGSLTTMCGELTDEGIIQCSFPEQKGRAARGRPLSSFSLTSDVAVSAIVSVTIDCIVVSLLNYSGHTIQSAEAALQTNTLTESSLTNCIGEKIHLILSDNPHCSLKHIAVSLQGPINSDSGVLIRSPILPLEDVPVAETLTHMFGVPVSVNNDCKFIARALFQSQRDLLGESFAAVTVSYGVGMGLYINGSPVKGAVSSALELGHILYERNGSLCRCGNRGCIEAYAATYSIFRKALGHDEISNRPEAINDGNDFSALIQSAKNGDVNAQEAFASAGSAIGTGVATIFTIFDPMPVALIGYSEEAWELMAKEFFASLQTATMGQNDFTTLIHYFEKSEELRLQGLAATSLSAIDHELAYRNTKARLSV